MSHTVGQTTTDYIWDVAAGLPVILQDGTNTYIYGLDLIFTRDDGSSVETYRLYDGLGSATDLIGGGGGAIGSYSYDVFGAIRSQTGSSPNYWLFTGEQRDSESELYYLRARYYDPAIGRFLGRDPFAGLVRQPDSLNRYVYVSNNAVNVIDPYGLCGLCGWVKDKVEDLGECAKNKGDCVTEPVTEFITETVPQAADWTRDQTLRGADWVRDQAIRGWEWLASCDWKKIAGGVAALGGAAVAVGLGGYVVGLGYGTAAGAVTLTGVVEGIDLMIPGGIIAGIGGGSLGVAGLFAFSQADCGQSSPKE